jgi:hypothetical protein
MTTLRDVGGVLGTAFGHFLLIGLSQFHGHGPKARVPYYTTR